MRRMLKVGLALAAVPLVISACSSGGSSSGTTSAATSAAGSAAASDTAAATGGGAASASTLTVWADNSANTAKAIEPLCKAVGRGERRHLHREECSTAAPSSGRPHPGQQHRRCARTSSRARTTRSASSSAERHPGSDRPRLQQGQAHQGRGRRRHLQRRDLRRAVGGRERRDAHQQGARARVPGHARRGRRERQEADQRPARPPPASASRCRSARPATATTGTRCFTADGGYAFAQNADGTYNPDDMGIGKPGGIAAAERLASSSSNEGIFKPSVTYDIARETFTKRQVAVLHHRPVADPRAARRRSATT